MGSGDVGSGDVGSGDVGLGDVGSDDTGLVSDVEGSAGGRRVSLRDGTFSWSSWVWVVSELDTWSDCDTDNVTAVGAGRGAEEAAGAEPTFDEVGVDDMEFADAGLVSYVEGPAGEVGVPLLDGTLAWFPCSLEGG